MAAKKGVDHHLARLSVGDVIRLRELYAAGGVSFMDLAELIEWRVDETTITAAVRGRTWKHIPGAIPVGSK